MFGLGPATKIYIALEAVAMRKGFEGLYGLVRDHLGQDPLSGHLFLFANQSQSETRSVVMRPEELSMLVNGMDLTAARPRAHWYRRVAGEQIPA